MFDLKLFLGFPVDPSLEIALSKVNPSLLSLFTSGGDYLSEIEYEKKRYLGKPIVSSIPVYELECLEDHLLSLLKKLAPTYPFSATKRPHVVTLLS